MAYITYDYYTNTYKGVPIPQDEFDTLAERASDIIDMLTRFKLKTGKALSTYPQFIQDNVMKATAAETEYLFNQGGASSINGSSGDEISSASIGNFNYSEDSGDSNLSREQKMVSPMVINFLSITGLLYRGVHVHDSSHRGYFYGY